MGTHSRTSTDKYKKKETYEDVRKALETLETVLNASGGKAAPSAVCPQVAKIVDAVNRIDESGLKYVPMSDSEIADSFTAHAIKHESLKFLSARELNSAILKSVKIMQDAVRKYKTPDKKGDLMDVLEDQRDKITNAAFFLNAAAPAAKPASPKNKR